MNTKKIALLLFCVSVFHSCKKERPEKILPKPSAEIVNLNDTIYKDSAIVVVKSKESIDTLARFVSSIDDKKFAVKGEDIALMASLDFSHYEHKKMFITRTKQGIKEQGVNFAGHYCFVFWGCGSPCKLSAVVDMKTGKVYDGPTSEMGYSFKKESLVLVVNPPLDATGYYNKNIMWQQPSEYMWTGKEFLKIQ